MRILVIKLAALGDVVLAFSAMKRIRIAHPDAEITLLTTPPYAGLAEASGLFDHVQTDGRPRKVRDLVVMLARLRRSLVKLRVLPPSGATPEWNALLAGYEAPLSAPPR